MASIEAQIAIILKGTSELNKLQSKLDKMYATIEKIAGEAIGATIEGTEDITKYSNALKKLNVQFEKLDKQLESQAAATNKSNAEIKQAIRLESQLRRERSLVSRFTREFTIETKGLDQTEGKLKDIKDRFSNLSGAFGKAFQLGDTGVIRELRNELRSLVQEQRDWNRTLTGTKKTGVNTDFLQEQARGYKEQIDALKARATALGENEYVIRKLNAAERNLVTGRSKEGTFLDFADPRLGREQLANMKQLINLQERQAKTSGDAVKENEKLSSAAVALDKQRQSALEKIFQIEEKIRSSKKISVKEARDYYFQAQLPRIALPFGDVNQPAVRGGARQAGPSMIQGRAEPRIREVLGGARTADEAAATLRLAQATQKLSQATRTIDPQYNRFLPDEKMLNASGRGIQRLTTSQEEFNQAVASGTRFQQKFNQEQERLRKIYGTPAPVGMAQVGGTPGGRGGRPTPFLEGIGIGQRGSAAISEGLIGGAFPLLFGQGVGASAGGLIGGVAGGFAGGGLGFGLSLIGTALGTATDEADRLDKELTKVNASIKGVGNTSAEVSRLASSLGIAKEEAVKLLGQFRQFSSAEIRKDLAFVFGGGREAILERLESVVKEEDVLQAIIAARKEIGNEEATSLLNVLRIQGGVKAQLVLQDALVRLKEREVIEDKKRIRLQDLLLAGFAAAGGGDLVDPKIFGEERAKEQQKIFNQQREQAKKNIKQALKESQEFFREVDKLSETYAEKDKDRKKKEKDNSSQIAAEQARQAEQFARNQIELDNAVFRNRMQLADQEFAARQRIAELQGKLLEAQSFGAQRDIVAFFNEISGIQRSYDAEARQLQQEVSRATQELRLANAMISAQQAGTTSIPAAGAKVSGVGGVTASSVAGYPITSGQGMRRHPVTGAMKMHAGTDIGTPSGTALSYSVGGAVTQATWLDGYGKVLEVQLENGVTAFAAHLNEVLVKAGQRFTANQLLARTGATGVGTGPHLHMEGRRGGDSTAPLPFLRLGGKPSGVMARGQSQVVGAEGDTAVAKANLDSQIAARQKLLPLLQQERNLKVQIAIAEQTQFLKGLQDQAVQMDREIEKRRIRNRLALEGVAPEMIEGEMRVYDILKQRDDKLKELNTQLTKLKLVQDKATISTVEAALADYDKKIATGSLTEAEKAIVAELEKKLAALKAIKEIEKGSSGVVETTRGIAKESIMSPREKVEGRIGELKKEIAELTNIGNLSIKVADGIGNAFGQAFQGLISGSMSAQEALSSFFKSVAESFLSMAAEIIAKQMTMIVLQTILKALGAVAGNFSGGTSSAVDTSAGGWANSFATPLQGLGNIGPIGFAKGGAFSNSIVSSPTLFQFADGGVTRMGEMGEDGPEAIMPLKRGPDGRLGVDASGMAVPYQRPAAAAATPEMEVPYQRSGSALAVPYLKSEGNAADDSMNATIDVKFETVRIGGVDYVTRDEAEQIGRESAQRGADLAHKRYRNSPSARRAAGLS